LLELLWQLGILSTVLIFGIKIGLAIGFAGLSKKVGVIIAASYGIGTLVLASIISGYANILYKVVYDYNFILFYKKVKDTKFQEGFYRCWIILIS